MFNKLEDSSVSAIRASKREPSKEPTQKDRPEAVSFCTGGIALSWQGNSFSSARARERGLHYQYRSLNQAIWCLAQSLPLRLQPVLAVRQLNNRARRERFMVGLGYPKRQPPRRRPNRPKPIAPRLMPSGRRPMAIWKIPCATSRGRQSWPRKFSTGPTCSCSRLLNSTTWPSDSERTTTRKNSSPSDVTHPGRHGHTFGARGPSPKFE
jgi:hypothetical protein